MHTSFLDNRFNSSNAGVVVVSTSTCETSQMQVDIENSCATVSSEGGWSKGARGCFNSLQDELRSYSFSEDWTGIELMTIGPFTNQLNKARKSNQRKGYYIWIPNHHDHINFLTSTNPIGSMWLVYLPTFIIEESPNYVPNMEINIPFLPWESIINRGGRSHLQGDEPWGEDFWVSFPKIDKDKKMMM